MHKQLVSIPATLFARLLVAATLLVPVTALSANPDNAISSWLGREITIDSSSVPDLMPVGGKLTFVFDSEDNAVRICTRTSTAQRGPWRMDMVPGCNVALTITHGMRYCTLDDVKAGNAEVLSACHRMRSHDIALRPAPVKGTIELHDVIVFPIQPGSDGKIQIAILVDSPSRVTDSGVVVGGVK